MQGARKATKLKHASRTRDSKWNSSPFSGCQEVFRNRTTRSYAIIES